MATADAPPRPPVWARFAARGVGVWILAGCLAKAVLGTPADLPVVVRRVPLPLGTTFALALAIEAFVGLSTALRPGRAWPLAALLLVAFSVVLGTQVAAGATSCGCFGSTVLVPPWLMLAFDLIFTALLVVARPWRLALGGRGDLVAGLAALAFAVALPLVANREATAGDASEHGLRRWATLDVESWSGRNIRATDLTAWADLSDARDGVWLLYRESCEACAECLKRMAVFEHGEREVTLVRLAERPTQSGLPRAVHVLPKGPFVHRIDLPDTVDWVVTAPARMVVRDGVVRSAKAPVKPRECR